LSQGKRCHFGKKQGNLKKIFSKTQKLFEMGLANEESRGKLADYPILHWTIIKKLASVYSRSPYRIVKYNYGSGQ